MDYTIVLKPSLVVGISPDPVIHLFYNGIMHTAALYISVFIVN